MEAISEATTPARRTVVNHVEYMQMMRDLRDLVIGYIDENKGDEPSMMSMEQLCQWTGYTPRHVRKLIDVGILKAYTFGPTGRKYFFKRTEVENAMVQKPIEHV